MRHPPVQKAKHPLPQVDPANKGLRLQNTPIHPEVTCIRITVNEPTVIIQGAVTPRKTGQEALQMSSAFEQIVLPQVSCIVFK